MAYPSAATWLGDRENTSVMGPSMCISAWLTRTEPSSPGSPVYMPEFSRPITSAVLPEAPDRRRRRLRTRPPCRVLGLVHADRGLPPAAPFVM